MRVIIACLFAAITLMGCATSKTGRPIDPETLGMTPYTGKTAIESQRLQLEAANAFRSIFGEPLPTSIMWDGPSTGWFTRSGQLSQLRAGLKMLRTDFKTCFPRKNWREVPIPAHYLSAMHLPENTPKKHMTCFLGQVKGKPAYLFWSEDAQTMLLVFDF